MPKLIRYGILARIVMCICFFTAITIAGEPNGGGDDVGDALDALNYVVELVDEGAVAEAVPELDAFVEKYRGHDDPSLRELARQALYLKVVALGQTDDHAAIVDASDAFIASADGDDTTGGAQVASALLHRALALSSLGEGERELDDYRRIIALYRKSPDDDMAEDAAAAMRNLGISLRESGDVAAGDALLNEMRVLFSDTRVPGALLHLSVAMQNIQQNMIDQRGTRSVAESAALAEEYGAIIDRHRDGDDPQTNEALARMMYARSALLYLAGEIDEADALGAELADRFKYEIEGDIRMVVASSMAQRGIILGAKDDKTDALAALDDYITVFSDAWEPEILDQMALVLLTRIRYLVASGDAVAVVAACDDYLRRHEEGGNPALARFVQSVETTRRDAVNQETKRFGRVLAHIHIPSTSRLTEDIAKVVEAVTAGSVRPIPAKSVAPLAALYVPQIRFFMNRDVAVDWLKFEGEKDGSWVMLVQRMEYGDIQSMLEKSTMRFHHDEENDAVILSLPRESAPALSRHEDGIVIASDLDTLKAFRISMAMGWRPEGEFGDIPTVSITSWGIRGTRGLALYAFLRHAARNFIAPNLDLPPLPGRADLLSLLIFESDKWEDVTISAARDSDGITATFSLTLGNDTAAVRNDGEGGELYSGDVPELGLAGMIDVTLGGLLSDEAVESLRGWFRDIGWIPQDSDETLRTLPGAVPVLDALGDARLGVALVDVNRLNSLAFGRAIAAADRNQDPDEAAAVQTHMERVRTTMKQTDALAGFGLTYRQDRVELHCRIPLAAANAVYVNRLAIKREGQEALRAYAKVRDGDPVAEAVQAAAVPEPPASLAELTVGDNPPQPSGQPVADPAAELAPFPMGGKWGFVDAHGQAVVPFHFDYVRPFGAHGLAPARVGEKWGFIDSAGLEAIPFRFEDARPYGAVGFAPVKLDVMWQYIDLEGNEAITKRFDDAHPFAPWGGALVEESGTMGYYINTRGECIGVVPAPGFVERDLAPFRTPYPDEKVGYINSNLDVVIAPRFRRGYGFDKNGLAPVEQDGLMGYIDATGEPVIPFQYTLASNFRGQRYAHVQKRDGSSRGYGLVDETGREVIPPIHDDVMGTPERGYVAMKKGDKWGLWSMDGTLLWPYEFERIDGYVNDPTLVRAKRDGKWGFMNVGGDTVIPFIYDEVSAFGSNEVAPATLDGKAGFIDKNGEEVIPFDYDFAGPFGQNGLAPVGRNGRFGYINMAGEIAIPLQYEAAEVFDKGGLAVVQLDGKRGVIDETGAVRVPFVYDALGRFDDEGITHAVIGNKHGEIDKDGRIVVPIQYGKYGDFSRNGAFKSMMRRLDEGTGRFDEAGQYDFYVRTMDPVTRRWNCLAPDGTVVLPQVFTNLDRIDGDGWARGTSDGSQVFAHVNGWVVLKSRFDRSISDVARCGLVRIFRDGKYGYIDIGGAAVIPPRFDAAWDFLPNGTALVREGDEVMLITTDGERVTTGQ
ncbi:MAG: WG repeat-containing protein [Planctomycetaceae bacterium]|nr:WG repeat-containing protein [Planctomycetaceae bacterium]